jgi:hypothetical protein
VGGQAWHRMAFSVSRGAKKCCGYCYKSIGPTMAAATAGVSEPWQWNHLLLNEMNHQPQPITRVPPSVT